MNHELKTKKIDIIAFSVMTAWMLFLTTSFHKDIKNYPDDPVMKILTALCAISTGIAGGQLIVDIKKYHDIKKELSKRTKEKTK